MNPSGIDFSTLPSLPLASRSGLPTCPAVYFALEGDREFCCGQPLLRSPPIFRHDELLLAGAFPAVGEVVSRLSWLLNFEAHFICGFRQFRSSPEDVGHLLNRRALEAVKTLFKNSSTLSVLGSTPKS